ncbi:glycosyltransferase family 4 protein [Aquimarina sp. D1M17]|uniref:glycosyltransferase family 4 protein n=1 Tax=Aquimarina acroporae TaxID=2937283 RepID=UPI0020BF2B01|nr:glycosyltransferase family 4 protein [Aquimarina acroporae]MCK8521839.1 glycosyltransferase family 4 protein [Aquimarina acroporae]
MNQHILIIGSVWPEPSSSAAGTRMLQLIHLFLKEKWQITFSSPANDTENMIDLETLGIDKVHIEMNKSSFDDFIQELNPSIVIFDRFMIEEQFGWRVAKSTPNALRILNTEDLHSLRRTRQECFKKNKPFETSNLLQNDITKREIASIYRCDLSLIISEYEISLLKNTFNINSELLHYLPFLFETITSDERESWPTFEERKHFVTIGNFRHEPNWNSILYLKETIWPLLKSKLPEAELHIYGAYPPPKAFQLHNEKEGFFVKGWTENSAKVIQNAKICLAPLRFGAGIKGKLAEAMLLGTPSVTTAIGAEGMLDDDSDWNGFIKDDAKEFAIAATRLYTNKDLWQQAQQNGIEIINTMFQRKKFTSSLVSTIKNLIDNLEEHRKQNFIGNMLQYHTVRSTEFMSRWIEEKNK